MQAKSMAGLASVASKANGNGVTPETVAQSRNELASLAAQVQANHAVKRGAGVAVPVDRVEVLTDPAKFYAAMMVQAIDGGQAGLSRDDIEAAIKYQATQARLGNMDFVYQVLVGNVMQLQLVAAKMLATAEATNNKVVHAELLQKAGKLFTDASKVACSVAGLARSE